MAGDCTSALVPWQSVNNMLIARDSAVPDVAFECRQSCAFSIVQANSKPDERLVYTTDGLLSLIKLMSWALPTWQPNLPGW